MAGAEKLRFAAKDGVKFSDILTRGLTGTEGRAISPDGSALVEAANQVEEQLAAGLGDRCSRVRRPLPTHSGSAASRRIRAPLSERRLWGSILPAGLGWPRREI